MSRQEDYTKAFLEQHIAGSLITSDLILHYKRLWWRNPYKPNSLNLTKQGFVFLRDTLKIEFVEFDLTSTLPDLVEILPFKDVQMYDNNLDGPWYVRKQCLIVFSGKDITMISLYGIDNMKKMLKRRNDK
jgi:hypothetical protein